MGGEAPGIRGNAPAVIPKSPEQQIIEELHIPIRDSRERFETVKDILKNLSSFEAKAVVARLKNPKDPLSAKLTQTFNKNELASLQEVVESRSTNPGLVRNAFRDGARYAEERYHARESRSAAKQAVEIRSQQNIAGQLQRKALSDKLNQKTPAQIEYARLSKGIAVERDSAERILSNFETSKHSYWIGIEGLAEHYRAGAVIQKDLVRTLGQLASKDPAMVTRAARYVSRMPESDAKFKNAFLRSTMELYEKQKPGSPAAASLATSAAEIIGRDSAEKQLQFMDQLNKSKKLESFIKDATSSGIYSGSIEIAPGWVHEEKLRKLEHVGNRQQPGQTVYSENPTGVSNLVKTLAEASVQDTRSARLPIPAGALEEIRFKTFNAASMVYSDPKRLHLWEKNRALKDGLSLIFRQDFDRIWKSALGENLSTFNNDSRIEPRLEGFFKHVLFMKPAGGQRDATSKFLAERMGNWLEDISNPKLSDKAFQEKYRVDKDRALDKTELTHIMGKTMGFMTNGMESAMRSARDEAAKEAARKTTLDFVIELGLTAASIVPGGHLLDKTVTPAINFFRRHEIGEKGAMVMAEIYENISDEAVSKLKDMNREEAAKFLSDTYPRLNPDRTMNELVQELSERIPSGNGNDLLSAFQSSLSHIDKEPDLK